MPEISVIIPAYNAQKTIKKTLESVIAQNYTDWEIILINDGSTDGTIETVKEIKDSRIKVFNYTNSGVAKARDRGIINSQGKYIAFLDADDFWTPDKLQLQLQVLQNNSQAGVAYSWSYFYYEETQKCVLSNPVYYQGNVYPQLLVTNFLQHGSNPLIKRQAIDSVGNFNSNVPHCADWDYYLRLAAKWHFIVVPKHQIYYRQTSNSMTSNITGIEKQLCQMIEQIYLTVPDELQHIKSQSFAWIYQYCTQQYLERGENIQSVKNALFYLIKAIRLNPNIFKQKYTHNLVKLLLKKTLTLLF